MAKDLLVHMTQNVDYMKKVIGLVSLEIIPAVKLKEEKEKQKEELHQRIHMVSKALYIKRQT